MGWAAALCFSSSPSGPVPWRRFAASAIAGVVLGAVAASSHAAPPSGPVADERAVSVLFISLPESWAVDERGLALNACTEAFSPGRCEPVESEHPADLLARVHELGPLRLLLEVTARGRAGAGTASRELSFQPADPTPERARAVGLTVGLLARSLVPPPSGDTPAPTRVDAAGSDPTRVDADAPDPTRVDAPDPTRVDAAGSDPTRGSGPADPTRVDADPTRVDAAGSDPTRGSGPADPTPADPTRVDARAASGARTPLGAWTRLSVAGVAGWDFGFRMAGWGGRVETAAGWPSGFGGVAQLTTARGLAGELGIWRLAPSAGLEYRSLHPGWEWFVQFEVGAEWLRVDLGGGTSSDARWSPLLAGGAGLRLLDGTWSPEVALRVHWLPSPTRIVIDGSPGDQGAAVVPLLSLGVSWDVAPRLSP